MNARIIILTLLCLILTTPTTLRAQDPQSPPYTNTADSVELVIDEGAPISKLLESAREMFIADNYALSEMLYKGVLIREPNNLSAMLELSVVYEAMGKWQYARGLLTRASIVNPYNELIIDRLNEVNRKVDERLAIEVDSLVAIQRYELAVPKLSQLLTTQPENAELYYQKAVCQIELGRPDVALNEIENALHLKKDDRYYELQKIASARIMSREVVILTDQAKVILAGELSADAEEEALQLVSRILEIDPENDWARGHFVALTDESASVSSVRSLQQRLVVVRAKVKTWFRPVGTWLAFGFSVLYDHLEVMLMILLALLILHSPLTHMLLRGFTPRQGLTGKLGLFSIHEVLTMINTHHATGALDIRATDDSGRIYFASGEVYHCKSGKLEGRKALQTLLTTADSGYFVFREDHRTTTTTIDTPLSLILMELPERDSRVTTQSIRRKKNSKMKELLKTK